MERTYQSPKVIQIYAQQCFGNRAAMPVDTWIETLFKWPLVVEQANGSRRPIFANATALGKVERLLWVASQARKVHSSACDDAIWCIKRASTDARGANPLACNICMLRTRCPAFERIKHLTVSFNVVGGDFIITTSAGDSTTPNQRFVSAEGLSLYVTIHDDFSPTDDPNGFSPFPDPQRQGAVLTVEDFVNTY